MDLLETIIQGIIQGLTEFLPVSSSGHLSLYQHFTGNSGEASFTLSMVLHLGTLLAIFIAFRKTVWSIITLKDMRFVGMMCISLLLLIPFYFFKDFVEEISTDNDIVIEGCCFLYTSVLLFLADKWGKGQKQKKDITVKNAVTVGIFQGIALMPGISRSGSTICGGLFSGFDRKLAVEYSFILGIPTILGGCVLELKDMGNEHISNAQWGSYGIGFLVALIVGLLSIKMVNWLIKSDKFKVFSIYTGLLGIVTITLGLIGV
ncbi:MAG: undecaprenyl-diphosphate phosphatase [Oscillospiraceae bacterium]|jgi:undecaprenyl-diphosphatase|nr:undecaprenyl-diphosphate phosphatase [Oscillospiraceae bacterium]